MQTLYSEPIAAQPSHLPATKRWLLLLESPDSALQTDFNALAGDAGKLLDNILRAAKLHTTAVVMLAPLVRSNPVNVDDPKNHLSSQLTNVLASAKPGVVLGLGRLAAQALLQSVEPLAKLRGHIHNVQGHQTIVTLDPAYLLRNPLDKAKVWDDVCLALSLTSVVRASR